MVKSSWVNMMTAQIYLLRRNTALENLILASLGLTRLGILVKTFSKNQSAAVRFHHMTQNKTGSSIYFHAILYLMKNLVKMNKRLKKMKIIITVNYDHSN